MNIKEKIFSLKIEHNHLICSVFFIKFKFRVSFPPEEINFNILPKIKETQSKIFKYVDKFYKNKYAPAELTYWSKIINWLYDENYKKNSLTILDLGCGYGTLSLFCKEVLGADVYAIDISKRTEKLFKDYDINFKTCNIDLIEEIPFEKKFDIIIMTEVIEHLEFNPIPLLKKLKDTLNEDGRLYLSTPNADNPNWGRVTKYYNDFSEIPYHTPNLCATKKMDDHTWQYTLPELIYIIEESGFVLNQIDYSNGTMNFNMQLKRKEYVKII